MRPTSERFFLTAALALGLLLLAGCSARQAAKSDDPYRFAGLEVNRQYYPDQVNSSATDRKYGRLTAFLMLQGFVRIHYPEPLSAGEKAIAASPQAAFDLGGRSYGYKVLHAREETDPSLRTMKQAIRREGVATAESYLFLIAVTTDAAKPVISIWYMCTPPEGPSGGVESERAYALRQLLADVRPAP